MSAPEGSPTAAIESWQTDVSDAVTAILDSLGDGGDDHRLEALAILWRLNDKLRAVGRAVAVVERAPDWKPRHKTKAAFRAHEKRRAA